MRRIVQLGLRLLQNAYGLLFVVWCIAIAPLCLYGGIIAFVYRNWQRGGELWLGGIVWTLLIWGLHGLLQLVEGKLRDQGYDVD